MDTLSIPAHFAGEHILLDEPVELEPDTQLIVTIVPKQNPERAAWGLSGQISWITTCDKERTL